jgi:hypothetical protein
MGLQMDDTSVISPQGRSQENQRQNYPAAKRRNGAKQDLLEIELQEY